MKDEKINFNPSGNEYNIKKDRMEDLKLPEIVNSSHYLSSDQGTFEKQEV
jgi:hypothetical protein